MTALSFFHKHPNRYEVLIFAVLALSVPTYYVGYEFASQNRALAICGIITFIASVRMALHCLAYPKPEGNFFLPLHSWWDNATRPGYYAVPESGGSMKIIRHVFCDFSEIYTLNGDLIGHEQDIWNDGHWTFKPVDVDSHERMPLIAFRRTKRQKPVGNLAEVISYDDTIVGHTTYTEHH